MLARCLRSAPARTSTTMSATRRLSSTRKTTDEDNNIVLAPEQSTATVFFLHGLGDTGHGWTDAMAMLAKGLPHVKFVLPTAPTMPVTLNMGMRMPAWYDITSLARASADNAAGIDTSSERIQALIDKEIAAGTPSSRIVLGGFSQGAAVSMFTAYQSKTALGGVVSMSGYLPRPDAFAFTPETAEVPLLMCHGDEDAVVRYGFGQMTQKKLESVGVKNLEFRTYEGMGHSASLEELEDVTAWLQRVLPDQAA